MLESCSLYPSLQYHKAIAGRRFNKRHDIVLKIINKYMKKNISATTSLIVDLDKDFSSFLDLHTLIFPCSLIQALSSRLCHVIHYLIVSSYS